LLARTIILLLLLSSSLSSAAELQSFVIDSEESWIRVLVYRAGLMSGLGHNHIVSSHEIDGIIKYTTELADVSVDMRFPVASLVVDNAALRDLEGDDFPGRLPEKDIQATRRNMLGRKLLDADNFSEIRIRSTSVSGQMDSMTVVAEIDIAGQTNSITFPASVRRSDNQLLISGMAQVSHRDLGLKPFSAGFGTLRVHQNMAIRFELIARQNVNQSATQPECTCHCSGRSTLSP